LSELLIHQPKSKIDLRRNRLINPGGEKSFFSNRCGMRFAQGPGPEQQTCEVCQHPEKIPQRQILIKVVLENSVVERHETRIKAKARRKRTIGWIYFHFVIMSKDQ